MLMDRYHDEHVIQSVRGEVPAHESAAVSSTFHCADPNRPVDGLAVMPVGSERVAAITGREIDGDRRLLCKFPCTDNETGDKANNRGCFHTVNRISFSEERLVPLGFLRVVRVRRLADNRTTANLPFVCSIPTGASSKLCVETDLTRVAERPRCDLVALRFFSQHRHRLLRLAGEQLYCRVHRPVSRPGAAGR